MDLVCNVHSANAGLLWSKMYRVELYQTVQETATLNQTDGGEQNGRKWNAQLIYQNPFLCSVHYFHYTVRHSIESLFNIQSFAMCINYLCALFMEKCIMHEFGSCLNNTYFQIIHEGKSMR